ncbi:FtsW/RodA/SpoVE family cell cycle protein [Allostreptomyces psammosilenae]|uniref:FtsW/RodA/SpoVE family cell cycle protein n=1 Tax=Allostreptomyces psammosilenae TaxID=1892865 RepID=UPI0015CAC796
MSTNTGATHTITPQGAPNRRNTELFMLGFAVLVPVFAYANVGMAETGTVPPGMLTYGAGLGALAVVAHLMVRRYAPYADPLMLPLATLLNGLGLVLIYRLDYDDSTASAPSQLMYSALGVALFLGVMLLLRDHRLLQRFTYISMVVALLLLISPLFFPRSELDFGARIWIRIGSFSIQPGEFAKIIICIFFAGYLMVRRDALALASRRFLGMYFPRGRDLGPIFLVWVLSLMILVFETDLGSSLLFFGLFVVMLYVATERTSWIVVGLLLSAAGAFVVGSIEPHVQSRVEDWLNPFHDWDNDVTGPTPGVPDGEPDHLVGQAMQALYSFGTGGVLGTGLGQGHPELIDFAMKSDFILTTVGEELGVAGMMALFLIYALLIERGLRTAIAARDPFGKLLAVGLSSVMALQVFVVAGGVMGLIPLTGMTLPFLAQGGSSVVTNWALVAILMKISDNARRPAPAPAPNPDVEETQVVRL